MLSRINLLDGFWKMLVEKDGKWNFAHMIPDTICIPVRLVVPPALQIGWAESPE